MSNRMIVSDGVWSYGDDPVVFDWATGTTKVKQGYPSEDNLCYFVWADYIEGEYEKNLPELRKKRILGRARVKQLRELRKRGLAKVFTDLLKLFPHWEKEDRKRLWGLWIESGA